MKIGGASIWLWLLGVVFLGGMGAGFYSLVERSKVPPPVDVFLGATKPPVEEDATPKPDRSNDPAVQLRWTNRKIEGNLAMVETLRSKIASGERLLESSPDTEIRGRMQKQRADNESKIQKLLEEVSQLEKTRDELSRSEEPVEPQRAPVPPEAK